MGWLVINQTHADNTKCSLAHPCNKAIKSTHHLLSLLLSHTQEAVEALSAYQQQVQAHEQQLQTRIDELQHQQESLTKQLHQLQLEHAPCAALK